MIRLIPCLQLIDGALVKTKKFSNPAYIGDPVNTVRIFNDLEADELCFLDIRAAVNNKETDYNLLKQIADECFMPLSYGGGVKDINTASKIFRAGVEKIVINSGALLQPSLITTIAKEYGSQAVIVGIDVKKNLLGNYNVMYHSATEKTTRHPVQWAREAADLGAGEILLTSVDREGTWSGFDINLINLIATNVSVPVIAHGGAASINDIEKLSTNTSASAAACGSMFVYQKKGMGVLINFPSRSLRS